MKRAALERRRALRVWRAHLARVHGNEAQITCACEFQPNRFRKTERVGGCLNSRCYLCHFSKLMSIPAPRTLRSNISHHEWLDELGINHPCRRRRR